MTEPFLKPCWLPLPEDAVLPWGLILLVFGDQLIHAGCVGHTVKGRSRSAVVESFGGSWEHS